MVGDISWCNVIWCEEISWSKYKQIYGEQGPCEQRSCCVIYPNAFFGMDPKKCAQNVWWRHSTRLAHATFGTHALPWGRSPLTACRSRTARTRAAPRCSWAWRRWSSAGSFQLLQKGLKSSGIQKYWAGTKPDFISFFSPLFQGTKYMARM